MRLFVSINLPAEIEEILHNLQREIDKKSERIVSCGERPFSFTGRQSGLHLTLAFLREIDVSKVLNLQSVLKGVEFEPFELKFSERLGFFKDFKGDVKVVNVDFVKEGEGYKKLLELQKKIQKIVEDLGIIMDGREFVPHIALARVKSPIKGLEEALKNISVSVKSFGVDAFYLMESFLDAGGAKYGEIAEFAGV